VDHDDAGVAQKFQDKIPVAHRIQAVAEHLRKSQLGGDGLGVDGEGGAGQGPGSQGRDPEAGQGFGKAHHVPAPHLIIGQQMVGKQDGLGPLHMGVAGHNYVPVLVGQPQPGPAQAG
jgi:hypothetical protein